MSRIIHHLTPTFRPHDALGTHVRSLHNLLEENGCQSFIWSTDKGEATPARAIKHFSASENGQDILIYQLAIGSPLADFALRRTETLVVNYHNMTPSLYLDKWAPEIAQQLKWGRRQLTELAKRTDLAIAVSEYNAAELRAAGFENVCVVPVLIEMGASDDDSVNSNPGAKGARWLFVGRLVPNKSQHDLVASLDAYRKLYDPDATLTLVGSGAPTYEKALLELAEQFGLLGAIKFKKEITEAEKVREFSNADVYISLSDHEGFGVPLLEAMNHGVPVVALDRAAVSETIGSGGLLIADKSPTKVAATVNELLSDAKSKALLVESGHRRVNDFDLTLVSERYLKALEPFL